MIDIKRNTWIDRQIEQMDRYDRWMGDRQIDKQIDRQIVDMNSQEMTSFQYFMSTSYSDIEPKLLNS